MFTLTEGQLKQLMPQAASHWVLHLNNAMKKWGIAESLDSVRVFLAQVAHESTECTQLEERLSYSAERLAQVFPRRFPTVDAARPYAKNPVKLANKIYADRMGNGDESMGDGYRYRGRGLIMVTGASNYARVGKWLNDPMIMMCPDRLRTPKVAAEAAAAWWHNTPRLDLLAEDTPEDNDEDDFILVRKLVNGGLVGLKETHAYWAKAKEVLV